MRKNNKFLVFLLIMVFVMGTTFTAYGASLSDIKDQIGDKEQELADGKKEYASLAKSIEALQTRINKTQKEIDSISGEIATAKVEIARVSKDLEAKKKELDKSKEGLDLRLRNMYKNGSVGFIDVLLSSGDVSELIANVELVKEIYKNDKEIVVALRAQYKVIKAEIEKLNAMKKKLETDKASLDSKMSSITADKADLAKKKASVSAANKKLEADIDKLNAEADRLTEIIQGSQGGGDYTGGEMFWPSTSRRVTSYFGYRIHPVLGYSKLHTGIDIGAGSGTNVYAANGGKVIASYYSGGYGNMVMIDHGGGIVTLYAHNSSLKVSTGQTVKRGQVIALIGSTGLSTGPHLHFEVRVNGNYVDPMKYL